MKMDIDFDKISKEALEIAKASIDRSDEMGAALTEAIMKAASKVIIETIKLYHQELLKD